MSDTQQHLIALVIPGIICSYYNESYFLLGCLPFYYTMETINNISSLVHVIVIGHIRRRFNNIFKDIRVRPPKFAIQIFLHKSLHLIYM